MKSILSALGGAKKRPRGMMPKAPKLDARQAAIKRIIGNGTLGKPVRRTRGKQPY